MSEGKRLRLFLALVPPGAVREALATAARALRHGGRPVPAENLHLTLVFLGPVPSDRLGLAETALDACAGSGAFELSMQRVGYWRRPRVLWCAPQESPAALYRLAGTARRELLAAGFEVEARPFAAHLTLARKVSQYRGQDHFSEPVLWAVDSVALVASETRPEGARYRTVRVAGLQDVQGTV